MSDLCNLGVGCNESGVCYAAAHNRPEMCGMSEEICQYCTGAGVIYGHEEAESEECSTCSGLGWMPHPMPPAPQGDR